MTRLALSAALLFVLPSCGPANTGDDTVIDSGSIPDVDPLAPDANPAAPDAFIPDTDPNEPNNDIGSATDVVLGTAIFGALGSTTDYDCFKISGVAARQVIVARVRDGTDNSCGDESLDSFIDLRDSSNTLLAQDDDDDLNMCSRITYRVRNAGDYYICFRLPEDILTLYDYSLLVRLVTPTITAETEDNDTDANADSFTVADGVLFTGEYDKIPSYPPPDRDYFTFTISGTHRYHVETVGEGTSNCGLVDTSIDNTIDLFDSTGSNRIIQDSDSGVYYCASFNYEFTAGTYYINSWPSAVVLAAELPFSYGILFLEEPD